MIYTLLKPILWLLFKIGLRLNVEGTENIPKDGPLVIASNHLSLLDPPVIGVAATRKVHFMAKQELFRFLHHTKLFFINGFSINKTRRQAGKGLLIPCGKSQFL